MHNIENLALELHNEFNPKWELDDTIEFIWQLKLNCLTDEEIRHWFMKTSVNTSENMSGIIVNHLPDEYIKDDWR